jgi:hypothetical protein
MLNFSCKSHRGRSTTNRTDAIVLVEVRDGVVQRVWAEVILNKRKETPLPIICRHVIRDL